MESVRQCSKSHKLYNFDCMWLSQLSLIAVVVLCTFLLLSLLLQICWQCCEKISEFRRCHADCQSCHLHRRHRYRHSYSRSQHDCLYCIRISACINLNVPHATYDDVVQYTNTTHACCSSSRSCDSIVQRRWLSSDLSALEIVFL